MSPEIQPADPRVRRRFLLAMILVAAVGAVALLSLDDHLSRLHGQLAAPQPEDLAQAQRAVRVFLALVAAAGVAFSLYFGRVSWRALHAERFPPPGTRVISDTLVRHGPAARRRAQAGLVLAIATLLLTLAVVASADRAFSRLLDAAPADPPAAPPRSPLLP